MRRALIALGVVAMVYAIVGALSDPDVSVVKQGTFLVAVLVAHDAILLPIAIGIGAAISRFAPARHRGILRAALTVSAIVTAIVLPLVLGRGRRPDIPSALPLDYPRGLLIVLGTIWVVVVAIIGWQERQRRRLAPASRHRSGAAQRR
jgi:hypothetical protein